MLLRALGNQPDSSLVLDSITPGAMGATLSGRAMRSDAATLLTQHLEPVVAQVGWAVHPPSSTGSDQLRTGGPWNFTIELTDQSPEAKQENELALTSIQKPSDAQSERKGDN